MDPLLFAAFTARYILLFIWAILIVKNSRPVSAAFLLPVILGLIYDNGILAAGSLIWEGSTLKLLNYARFWMDESAAAVNAFEWLLLLSLTATAYFQKKRCLTKT
ncbi:hypothetical protein ACOSZF_09560 [Cytobacillus firmus]|uniref:Uncharacterized protein n=1 Tax=Cytobacillus firmus TaxID=1399 RepID=A0A380Y2M1_CYTFI|nr:hypothetical protein [Cytobacillus firmus]KAF0821491.1 hypothetical protein KIS1582_4791 [Cytobacillus firmus]MBG9545206.1 hypothetical protein [Cytobacillus firmus]MBG9545871.1 hypothetical protein [Cytobacillus firmus]MBG9554683.1 hypothetical protein [Cytobacillus firmus]MBG9574273.1 hypothetical protein [Cytobacillus firmus]